MAYYFDESYYLTSKLAQLKAAGVKNGDADYTESTLKALLIRTYGSAQNHYEQQGRTEGLNPNAYFNEDEYLQAKAGQLNSIKHEGRTNWTAEEAKAAIEAIPMLPVEHYEQIGCFETDADGRFINPSNAFDANAYYSAKLYLLQQSDSTMTLEKMLAAFADAGFSPISHYVNAGAAEVNASGNAFAQTVPMGQRVANDPSRAMTGDITPTNYMANTPAPTDANARAAQDPADVGNLANTSVSARPTAPAVLAPVSGDNAAPPSNVKDTPATTILPPSSADAAKVSGNWLVVPNAGNTAVVVGSDGAILGTVGVSKTRNAHGEMTVTVNGGTDAGGNAVAGDNLPVSGLAAADKDALPGGVTVIDGLNNNFGGENGGGDGGGGDTPPPVSETGGIVVEQGTGTASGNLVVTETIRQPAGASSLTLAAGGAISAYTGYKVGETPDPALRLGAGGTLNAAAVTGSGTLTLDASACTVTGLKIIGATAADNVIRAGSNTASITGGGKDDTMHLSAGTYSLALTDTAGTNKVNMAPSGSTNLTLTSATYFSGTITGGTGNDDLRFETGAKFTGTVALGDGHDYIYLGADAYSLALVDAATSNSVFMVGGGGTTNLTLTSGTDFRGAISGTGQADTLELEAGAKFTGTVALGGGDDIIRLGAGTYSLDLTDIVGTNKVFMDPSGATNLTLASGTDFGGTITGGGGNDAIIVETGGMVRDTIEGGDGDDSITLSGTARNIYGGNDNDTITVNAGGVVNGDIEGGDGGDADKITLAVGAKVTGAVSGGDSGPPGADTDTLYVSGAGRLDLSGNAVSGFERLDLANNASGAAVAGAQRLTLSAAALENAATVYANAGDAVVFSNLTTAMAGSEAAVNGTNTWHYEQTTGKLTWWNGSAQQFIFFNQEGRMDIDQASGAAVWWHGTAVSGITLADGGGVVIMVMGAIAGAGATVKVAADGNVSADPGAGGTVVLNPDPMTLSDGLDAWGVTVQNDGVLVLDTSAYNATNLAITGSLTARNDIRVKNAEVVTGGGNDDTITVSGTVGTSVYGGAGNDTITVSGMVLNDGIYGGDGDDAITVETGGMANTVNGGAGNDTITVNGTVTGTINGGDGDDTITVSGTVTSWISGGAGADTVVLEANNQRVLQYQNDSGRFTETSGETVSTAAFDVVDCTNATADAVRIWVNGYADASDWDGGAISTENSFADVFELNNACYAVTGTYDAAAGTFTAGNAPTDEDCLLVYDADVGNGVQMEAVVVVGLNSAGIGGGGGAATIDLSR